MSFRISCRSLSEQFRLVGASFLQAEGLPFADVLPEDKIEQVFDRHGVAFGQDEDDVYTPAITLWAFLSQVLHREALRSCAAAVARVITLLVASGRSPCSDNTGAYCRARAKLAEPALEQLVQEVADGCELQVPRRWLWKGRHVRLVDGTTVYYAQPRSACPTPKKTKRSIRNMERKRKVWGFPSRGCWC